MADRRSLTGLMVRLVHPYITASVAGSWTFYYYDGIPAQIPVGSGGMVAS